jgi:hypothetical protein
MAAILERHNCRSKIASILSKKSNRRSKIAALLSKKSNFRTTIALFRQYDNYFGFRYFKTIWQVFWVSALFRQYGCYFRTKPKIAVILSKKSRNNRRSKIAAILSKNDCFCSFYTI